VTVFDSELSSVCVCVCVCVCCTCLPVYNVFSLCVQIYTRHICSMHALVRACAHICVYWPVCKEKQ